MPSFNQVTVVGHLTRDVELKYLPSGTAVADIGIAVNEYRGRGDDRKEITNYFDVTVFGRTAEVCSEYLSKGSAALFNGRLQQERWETDGQKRSKVKIVAETMQMLDSKGGGSSSESVTAGDDEVPF